MNDNRAAGGNMGQHIRILKNHEESERYFALENSLKELKRNLDEYPTRRNDAQLLGDLREKTRNAYEKLECALERVPKGNGPYTIRIGDEFPRHTVIFDREIRLLINDIHDFVVSTLPAIGTLNMNERSHRQVLNAISDILSRWERMFGPPHRRTGNYCDSLQQEVVHQILANRNRRIGFITLLMGFLLIVIPAMTHTQVMNILEWWGKHAFVIEIKSSYLNYIGSGTVVAAITCLIAGFAIIIFAPFFVILNTKGDLNETATKVSNAAQEPIKELLKNAAREGVKPMLQASMFAVIGLGGLVIAVNGVGNSVGKTTASVDDVRETLRAGSNQLSHLNRTMDTMKLLLKEDTAIAKRYEVIFRNINSGVSTTGGAVNQFDKDLSTSINAFPDRFAQRSLDRLIGQVAQLCDTIADGTTAVNQHIDTGRDRVIQAIKRPIKIDVKK